MNAPLRWLPLLCWMFALAGTAAAQAKLTVQATLRPLTAKPGDEVELVLTAKTPPGFHAYGTKEETNPPVALRAKRLKLVGFEVVGDAVVPPGELERKLGVDTYPLPAQFVVTQKLRVTTGFAEAEAVVEGVLDYQLCDANSCLAPAKAPFTARLAIAGAKPAAGAPEQRTPDQRALEQRPPEQKPFVEPAGRLQVVPRIEPNPARAGERIALVLDVTVLDAAYHVYGTDEKVTSPIALDANKLDVGALRREGTAELPAGEMVTKHGIDTHPLPKQFTVRQALSVPEGTAPGEIKVAGVFEFQMCSDTSCDAGITEVPFSVAMVVEGGVARAATEPAVDDAPDDDPRGGSLWQLLLACIGGGLFALVMPCTYPMIQITFSFFTKTAEARGGRVLSVALTYGAGIVVMFALIGALAGQIGEGIARFAAHWVTNLVIGTAFLVFALSLLGLFTLRPPQFLLNAAGNSRKAGGLVGVLLMGATLVITSFTCTAPIVGLLLLPAVQSGQGVRPVLGMAVFGLTMALPFVLLALVPGRVRTLPRSGEWMNTLKVTLGFIELAAAVKFFSNAEYVAQLYWLPRELFFGIWIVLFVALAVFLLGLLPKATVSNGRRIGGLASLAFAGYCLYGALGYRLDKVMTAFAPPYGASEIARHEIVVDDYEAALAKAKAAGKLVLVNFTGFTCNNCRMVEKGIMPDDAIAPLLERHFVEARLHMDNPDVIEPTNWERHLRLRKELIEGRITTPTYVSVDPATGKTIVEYVLSGDWVTGYQNFLQSSLQKVGRS